MKTQISRWSFSPEKRYSGVYQQMGRMLTDDDWNSLVDLLRHGTRDALFDVVGSGSPRGRGMVRVEEAPDGTLSYSLEWGYAYADGIICQVRPDPDAALTDPLGASFEYPHQADFPDAPDLPAGDYTLYLDVWDRSVTVLEDESLRDPGLHGADTCTRSQTMAQVKWCPVGVDPEDPAVNPAIGGSLVTLELRGESSDPDPCDPCAEEIALQDDVADYLFRVEIHDVTYEAGAPTAITLKWSRENGAEQYELGGEPPGFVGESWTYEYFSGEGERFASEKHLGRHLAVGAWDPTRGVLSTGFADPVPPNTSLVRRWDGFCRLEKSGADWELVDGSDRGVVLSTGLAATAHGRVVEGAEVTINADEITITADLNDHAALAGDYWQAAVRGSVHAPGDVVLDAEAPHGILHHYVCLGTVTVADDVFTPCDADVCKRFDFPSLTDLNAGDICVDGDTCAIPAGSTVQDAIDFLCRERDLRWHNKHLHGWGIVCGLIAECGPDTLPDDGGGEAVRREVRVTSGYALDCEGEDVVLEQDAVFDLMDRISELEEGPDAPDEPVLEEGDGTVCLRVELDESGEPRIVVEPYEPESVGLGSILDGTLMMDFVQDCVLGLFEAITDEFQFTDPDDLEEIEVAEGTLISKQRRELTSLLNLIIQLFGAQNGSYVYLARKEHLILRDLYLRLREILQSKTFCGMFQGSDFPEYPFADRDSTTYFGKNRHTRITTHPSGRFVYTYGGTDSTINVYEVETQELVEVIDMPSAEGAEVTAISFTPDGRVMYAAAIVRGVDTVLGRAAVGEPHAWEEMAVLCDLVITEMLGEPDDADLIYAIGAGQGFYRLRPELLFDETKPEPRPTFGFNAVGHLGIDFQSRRAYATSNRGVDLVEQYDEVVELDLGVDPPAPESPPLPPTLTLLLTGANGAAQRGDDGLAVRQSEGGEGGRLFVVVDGTTPGTKTLFTYALPLSAGERPTSELGIEDTGVALAYHAGLDRLLMTMEDGYRIQTVAENGEADHFRTPVQIQPVDLAIDADTGAVYALNFVSDTVSVVPQAEVGPDAALLNTLAAYRTDILEAFFALLGGLFQYLKDCFCHLLLVKCPTCTGEEKLFLAVVEVRDNQVYNVCNFDKRKYVKSFPTYSYWLSALPVLPLVKWGVGQFCCALLPNLFDGFRDNVIRTDDGQFSNAAPPQNRASAKTIRQGMRTFGRTDFRSTWRTQRRNLSLQGNLGLDATQNMVQQAGQTRGEEGVRRSSLANSSVPEAVAALERSGMTVAEVRTYDQKAASGYLKQYRATSDRIEPGSSVTLYEKDGKVVFYSTEPSQEVRVREVSNEVKSELTQLESRREALASELAVLRTDVETVRAEREAETARLEQLETRRRELSSDLGELDEGLNELAERRAEARLEIARDRRARDVEGVGPQADDSLREIGIRSVGELADAKESKLTADRRFTSATAKKLIAAAKKQVDDAKKVR